MPADWRFLPYLLRFQRSLEPQEITGEDAGCTSPVLFPDDPDEPLSVVFTCTLNEFTQILSSVIKGAQLSYPDTFVDVMNMFMRNWECDVTLCEEIAACIEENEETQNALNRFFSGSGGAIPGLPITEEEAAADVTPENIHDGEECDLNAAWGAALYLTQSANRTITDFFESTETLTNTLERMTKVVGLIPAVGNTIENLAQFADELYDDLKEGYAGAYNETLEEEIACLVFCSIRDDCELSVDDIIAIFAARLGALEPTVFASVITFIGTGTFVGESIVDAMFFLYFTALKFGQAFGNVFGIRPLTQLMGLGADQLASDNWETLCDCPGPEWDFVVNFETGENIDWVEITAGTYEPGVGLHQEFRQLTNGYETINLLWNTEATSRLTHYEVDADYSAGELAGGVDATFYFGWNASPETVITAPATPTFPETWDGDSPGSPGGGTGLQIMPGVHIGTGDPGGTALLRSITFHGTGTPPV